MYQASKATPALPGRSAQHRGVLVLSTAWVLPFLVLFIVWWWNSSVTDPGGPWLALFWAALLADAWASATALREAARGVPRPVNRWDLAASVLAGASMATVAIVLLAAEAPVLQQTIVGATAMTFLSALVLAWFVWRARLRAGLSDALRGWPRDDRGKARIPVHAFGATGTNVALGVCGLILTVPRLWLEWSALFAPLAICLAAETAALTRRATDTWWERPPVGFSRQDLFSLVVACVALPVGAAVFVLHLPVISGRRWDAASVLFPLFLILDSATVIVRGRRRWMERHTPTDWLSVWD